MRRLWTTVADSQDGRAEKYILSAPMISTTAKITSSGLAGRRVATMAPRYETTAAGTPIQATASQWMHRRQ